MRSRPLRRVLVALVVAASSVLALGAAPASAADEIVLEHASGVVTTFCIRSGQFHYVQTLTPARDITVTAAAVRRAGIVFPKMELELRETTADSVVGPLLARSASTPEPDGVWSKVQFPQPVKLLAGRTYGLGFLADQSEPYIPLCQTILGDPFGTYPGGSMHQVADGVVVQHNPGFDLLFRLYNGNRVTAPVITTPGDVQLEGNAAGGATADLPVTAADEAGPVATTCAPATTSTFPVGTTTVRCTATGSTGLVSTGSFAVTVVDTTAPALVVPGPSAIDAASPAGAAVTFAASATDVVDGAIAAVCTPASGSTFAIGTTTVTCTATDVAGNASTGSFAVSVRGAAQQLQALGTAVVDVGAGTSLSGKVAAAQAAIAAGDAKAARGQLGALVHQVDALAGKKLTAAQAGAIKASVQRVLAVLG